MCSRDRVCCLSGASGWTLVPRLLGRFTDCDAWTLTAYGVWKVSSHQKEDVAFVMTLGAGASCGRDTTHRPGDPPWNPTRTQREAAWVCPCALPGGTG